MGQEIVYCFKCQTRLLAADFEKGRAVRHAHHVACSACAPELLRSLSPEQLKEVFEKPGRRPSAPPRPASTRRMPVPRPRSGPPLVAAAVAAVLLAGILALVLGRPSPPPSPPSPTAEARPPAVPPPPAAPVPDPLETTRTFLRELAEIDGQARPLVAAEKFGEARSLYEAARGRRPAQEWTALLDGKIAEVAREAQRRLPALKDAVAEARRAGRPQEARAVRDRVEGWGLPSILSELDAFLATVPEERPWREIFDGRSLGFLVEEAHSGWVVEDGLLVKSRVDNAAQTADSFGDGEFRFRFDGRDLYRLDVYLRQKSKGAFAVNVPKPMLDPLGPGVHELRIRISGAEAEATLDGRAVAVKVQGTPGPQGRIQFNGQGQSLRFHSIAVRP